MHHINLYVKIVLFLLFISSIFVFQERQRSQLNEIYINAENIKKSLESNLQSGIEAVKYLNTSAQLTIDNKNNLPLKFSPLIYEYNSQGNYTADKVFDKNITYEEKANISGYGGLKKDKETLQEMEISLSLIRYFKLIKEQNKDYAWVYYYSNKNFITLYPFMESKDFALLPEYKDKPLMTYATPKINPNKELFFTPLYIDNGGMGLMVTIGMPVYDKEKFLGATELDMTLESQSALLKRLDYLDKHSVIINKENEVIAINNIAEPNSKKIVQIDSLIDNEIVALEDTQGALTFIDSKYVYTKKFQNTPWKFIYYEKSSKILLKSFLAALPLILIMAFLFYFNKMYEQIRVLSIELKKQAVHDFMTGCYNRRYFYETALAIFFNNKRKNTPIAVAMIDIDDFKKINDTYGHSIGDIAIKEVPNILHNILRKSDLVARAGGEEFLVLLEDITLENTQKLFERIRECFENNTITINENKIKYTISCGIAYGIVNSLDDMINSADEALYDSKNSGKNKVTIR